ncbi:MAG: nucleotidyltransferase family protein [Lunatimonas sp.]|uniref:nucleotidyltransferase domain-containing protein n=1 Tax=Lunatimonas sp. TaxID=2060141 RepID=UPI00263B5FD4|nr:nucleotidyltransferase family protein [Lunatimonas sp.]MCC5936778.1 nucleotidyltransferase family protein [Lunatimonas sp.]
MHIQHIEAIYGRPTAIVLMACRVYLETASMESFMDYVGNSQVDWKEVIRLCRAHRIRPTAYRVLLKVSPPAPWAEMLKKELQKLTMQSMDKARETTRLIGLLLAEGITVFPYKGVAFSKRFYGEIGLRESGDIDLIIRPSDLPAINEALKKDGYLPEEEDYQQFLGWERFTRAHRGYNLQKLDRQDLPVHLELHWRIIYDYFGVGKFDNEFSFQASDQLQVYDKTVPVQDNYQQFKYLYLHHSLHDGHGYLKTALDIAMGLKSLNLTKEDYSNQPVIREITETFSLPVAVHASNQLFATTFELPTDYPTDKTLGKLLENTLMERSKRPDELGKNFFSYFHFHTSLIRKRALFYPEKRRKMVFYYRNLAHFFHPNFIDYRIFRPKSMLAYRLIWIIRPIRHFFLPTDPLRRDMRSEERALLQEIKQKSN